MDPMMQDPRVQQMLAALAGGQAQQAQQPDFNASLGNQQLQPGMGATPNPYAAMMTPSPMTPPPAPMY